MHIAHQQLFSSWGASYWAPLRASRSEIGAWGSREGVCQNGGLLDHTEGLSESDPRASIFAEEVQVSRPPCKLLMK